MTADAVGEAQLAEAMADLERAKQRLVELRRRMPAEPVADYELAGPDGSVKLSAMFGDKSDLIVVHNMGSGCPYCTLWADGFNGVLSHLESRAAFVVVSPDAPEVQQRLAGKRGWRFRMVSAEGTTFIEDMGFGSEEEHYDSHAMPGVSAFHKNPDGAIVRVARDFFGPGDLYCGVWHLFDLLRDGPGDWEPKFDY
ncbi:MAG: DUF899 family protein [Chloroflexota bacterium]|nr:DUF899 family protein [Chloroflexota bacterium]MDE2930263.1 DUF899 family protein [Chloroflexota bacterium]